MCARTHACPHACTPNLTHARTHACTHLHAHAYMCTDTCMHKQAAANPRSFASKPAASAAAASSSFVKSMAVRIVCGPAAACRTTMPAEYQCFRPGFCYRPGFVAPNPARHPHPTRTRTDTGCSGDLTRRVRPNKPQSQVRSCHGKAGSFYRQTKPPTVEASIPAPCLPDSHAPTPMPQPPRP